jgi:hypothetical protein
MVNFVSFHEVERSTVFVMVRLFNYVAPTVKFIRTA